MTKMNVSFAVPVATQGRSVTHQCRLVLGKLDNLRTTELSTQQSNFIEINDEIKKKIKECLARWV